MLPVHRAPLVRSDPVLQWGRGRGELQKEVRPNSGGNAPALDADTQGSARGGETTPHVWIDVPWQEVA